MVFASVGRIVIFAVGVLHPAYRTYKALNERKTKDCYMWMTYWVVAALFRGLSFCCDPFLSWCPLYEEAKVALIIWLLPSQGNGCALVYIKCVQPFLQKNERCIDAFLARLQGQVHFFVVAVARHSWKYAHNIIVQLVQRHWRVAHVLSEIETLAELPPVRPTAKSPLRTRSVASRSPSVQSVVSRSRAATLTRPKRRSRKDSIDAIPVANVGAAADVTALLSLFCDDAVEESLQPASAQPQKSSVLL